jgi:hypothetical protein
MTTNTRPVPNIQSAIAASPDGKVKVYLLNPWSQWFQQFTQKSPAAIDVTQNPYTPNATGTLIITGTGIVFTRGLVSINLVAAQNIIPMNIGDTVSWASASSVKFLGT